MRQVTRGEGGQRRWVSSGFQTAEGREVNCEHSEFPIKISGREGRGVRKQREDRRDRKAVPSRGSAGPRAGAELVARLLHPSVSPPLSATPRSQPYCTHGRGAEVRGPGRLEKAGGFHPGCRLSWLLGVLPGQSSPPRRGRAPKGASWTDPWASGLRSSMNESRACEVYTLKHPKASTPHQVVSRVSPWPGRSCSFCIRTRRSRRARAGRLPPPSWPWCWARTRVRLVAGGSGLAQRPVSNSVARSLGV